MPIHDREIGIQMADIVHSVEEQVKKSHQKVVPWALLTLGDDGIIYVASNLDAEGLQSLARLAAHPDHTEKISGAA